MLIYRNPYAHFRAHTRHGEHTRSGGVPAGTHLCWAVRRTCEQPDPGPRISSVLSMMRMLEKQRALPDFAQHVRYSVADGVAGRHNMII